jgi:RNA polymerase primary sigma factor
VIDLEATFGRSLGDDDDGWTARICRRARCRRAPAPRAGAEPELDADGNPIMRARTTTRTTRQSNMSLAAMEAALKPACWKRWT